MNELKQDSIFVVPEKEKKVAKEITKQLESDKGVPIGYVPVHFTSGSVLGPATLHFRNYSMEELLELSSSNEDNQLYILVTKVLNNLVYEKFDCSNLHIEHIKQIMLTLYLNFWGSKLISRPYYKDLDGDLESRDNVGYVDIELSKLDDLKLDPKFKEPFSIKDTKTSAVVQFILPRVMHLFFTEKYIKEFYEKEEKTFSQFKSQKKYLEKLREGNAEQKALAEKTFLDPDVQEKYEEFEREKSKKYLKVLQSQLIYSVDGKVLDTIEEKLDAYKTLIDAITWNRYRAVIEKYATFGINDNYTFKDDNGTELTRGFSFRYVDFVPTVDNEADTGYTVYFDD